MKKNVWMKKQSRDEKEGGGRSEDVKKRKDGDNPSELGKEARAR